MAQCAAKSKRSGERCKGQAVTGSDKCRMHGAGGGKARTNAQRNAELEQARIECAKLGLSIQIDPGEALVQELWETAGNVAFYRQLVQDLPTHPDPDTFVAGGMDQDGSPGHWERGAPGVYGRSYHVSGLPTGEAKPHILVQLYNDERKHLTDVAASALKAGVDQRRVELEQERASLMADIFRRVFEDPGLELTAQQQRAGMMTAAKHLRLVAS